MFFNFLGKVIVIAALSFGLGSAEILAKGSNELLYSEAFDLAAGGTTLTRSSQEGIVFANPALLPLGGAWVRWLGFQAGFLLDRDLAANAKDGIVGPFVSHVMDYSIPCSNRKHSDTILSARRTNRKPSAPRRGFLCVNIYRRGDPCGRPVYEIDPRQGQALSLRKETK